ncbi:MAG: TIGR04197 family type VII secretion effector [Bacilli bacterium]
MISSNSSEANKRASSLKRATSNLNKNIDVVKDVNTTLIGNNKASAVIDINSQVIISITNSINKASANINSVSKEFIALDYTISSMIEAIK